LLARDWTYVDDTVDGVLAALERPMGYQIINLGYGAPVTLREFISIYETLIGKRAILLEAPAPLSEPRITFCDNTRARERIGFTPKIDLHEGLARVWAWYQTEKLT
jgi:UDP-glucuronate 4-epimerase